MIGSRDLNSRFTPRLNVATDGDEIAALLVDGGASAYFFERPEENRIYRDPERRRATDPRLRHRHARLPLARSATRAAPTGRTPCSATPASCWPRSTSRGATRAPTARRSAVRLIPLIEDLSLQARRRHAAAPQPPGAVPGPRPAAASPATAGASCRARTATPARPAPTRTSSLPAAAVPGRRAARRA